MALRIASVDRLCYCSLRVCTRKVMAIVIVVYICIIVKYVHHRGGCSILSLKRYNQVIDGVQYCRGYHRYCGEFLLLLMETTTTLGITSTVVVASLNIIENHPQHWWYPPTVLNTLQCTESISPLHCVCNIISKLALPHCSEWPARFFHKNPSDGPL